MMIGPHRLGFIAAAATGGGTSYEDEVMSYGPEIYCRLEESSGTTAVNEAGNDATYVGSPTLGQAGLIVDGNAVLFDGTDDAIRTADQYSSMTELSVAAWISTSVAAHHIMGYNENQGSLGTSAWIHFWVGSTGTVHFGVWNGSSGVTVESTTAVTDGATYFVVGVLRGGSLYLYINGTEVATTTVSPSIGTGYWHIGEGRSIGSGGGWGDDIGANPFNGTMDEPTIYHVGLTADEVSSIYNAGVA